MDCTTKLIVQSLRDVDRTPNNASFEANTLCWVGTSLITRGVIDGTIAWIKSVLVKEHSRYLAVCINVPPSKRMPFIQLSYSNSNGELHVTYNQLSQ